MNNIAHSPETGDLSHPPQGGSGVPPSSSSSPIAGTPEQKRDVEWVLALAEALGPNSSHNVPLSPDPHLLRRLLEDVIERRLNVVRRTLDVPGEDDPHEYILRDLDIAVVLLQRHSGELGYAISRRLERFTSNLRAALEPTSSVVGEPKRERNSSWVTDLCEGLARRIGP